MIKIKTEKIKISGYIKKVRKGYFAHILVNNIHQNSYKDLNYTGTDLIDIFTSIIKNHLSGMKQAPIWIEILREGWE